MKYPILRTIFQGLLIAIAILAAGIAALINGGDWESELFPVSTQWQALTVKVEGADLIVAGTMVKTRSCGYIPPPRARDESGLNMKVISMAATAGQSWAPADGPQHFGPWRVINGAGKKLTFYQEHKCHGLWPTFTTLGNLEGKP